MWGILKKDLRDRGFKKNVSFVVYGDRRNNAIEMVSDDMLNNHRQGFSSLLQIQGSCCFAMVRRCGTT
jgi:hypothetical protein